MNDLREQVQKVIADSWLDFEKSHPHLAAALDQADGMHHDVVAQAKFLTSTGADAMAHARTASDALELAVGDDCWPLPKYREMLFPV